MKSTINIPKKINVGFQNRQGTYTGKLAYIIYFDEKGKLRKETSWNGWRDKKIENQIHENVPTSGFVLNKKAGGYSTGWNHRQTYVRVYDPRGFEFEITVPNLLYILENATSTKGKGLEGEFIYGWDGKDLVLIPCESPDYIEISQYNEKVQNKPKLKGKDLKIGGTYLSKSNKEVVYIGRYDLWDYEYVYPEGKRGGYKKEWRTKRKTYFFADKETNRILEIGSLSNGIIEVISEECVDNYAELFEALERSPMYSPVNEYGDEYVDYALEEIEDKIAKEDARGDYWWGLSFYSHVKSKNERIRLEKVDNKDNENHGRYYYEYKVYYTVEPKYTWQTTTRTDWKYERKYFDSVEEIYEYFKPKYLRRYLMNGKIYSEDK